MSRKRKVYSATIQHRFLSNKTGPLKFMLQATVYNTPGQSREKSKEQGVSEFPRSESSTLKTNPIGRETGVEIEIGRETGVEIFESLSKTQRSIIMLVAQNNLITQKAMSEKTGVALSTIIANIDLLKKQNILAREGATKKGRWVILKPSSSQEEGEDNA